ncbi:MAG: penicillin-binding protein 2 [Phycisphaeraceae bacterium]
MVKTNAARAARVRRRALRPPKGTPIKSDPYAGSTGGAGRVLVIGRVMISLVTVAMVALLARVVQLQTLAPPPVQRLVNSQSSLATFEARRGSLLDRRGRPIAITRVVQRLFIDPRLIDDPVALCERVGHTLGYDPAWIEKKLSARPNSRYIVIDQRLDDNRVEQVKSLRLAGLATEPRLLREYPQGPLAGAMIGFVGFEGKGLEGLERTFENELAGHNGSIRYLRDARRRPLWVEAKRYQPSRDGRTIRLTLDLVIQSIAEAQLSRACEQFAAESGQLIVMHPGTGQILAMANWPGFDPADANAAKPRQWRNRCVTDVHEPGSTFKPFIYAATIDAAVAHPLEVIDSNLSPPGRRLHDTRDHGPITVEQGLIKSSNRLMAQLGLRMGSDRLHAAVRGFGFGTPTGSGLPGEVAGIVHRLSKWTKYSMTSVPIGQEIAVTPLQMTRAFSVFANGGLLVTPTIRMPDEHATEATPPPIYRRVISAATADHTRHVLRRVVTEGTGHRANSRLYAIFGKTGTAQVAQNGRYVEGQYVASFIGGAPFDDPQIVVGCTIHRPDPSVGYYGGLVAGPVVRAVIEQSLIYMGVTPQQNDQDISPVRFVRE